MDKIVFLRPTLPSLEQYGPYLKSIEQTRIYSNFGPLTRQFESRLIDEWCDGGYGTTVANATLGLIIAIQAMKRPGGKVAVLPSFTFAATAQAARWCGLELHYVDIDPASWTMDPDGFESAVAALGDDLAIVITYATFGVGLDLQPYQELIARGIPVMVDAAPGFGTRIQDRPFGHGFGGAIVYSFHATKPFGIGEGGFIYSADSALVERLRRASNFGFIQPGRVAELGINCKLSEFAAAVGLAALDGFADKKRELDQVYRAYCEQFADLDLNERGCALQQSAGDCVHQFLPLLLPPGRDKTAIIAQLEADGIEVRSYFDPPCHHQVGLEGHFPADLAVTETTAERILCLPLWQGMELEQTRRVLQALANALEP